MAGVGPGRPVLWPGRRSVTCASSPDAATCPRSLDCTLKRRARCPPGAHACGPCLQPFHEDSQGRCVSRAHRPPGMCSSLGRGQWVPSVLWGDQAQGWARVSAGRSRGTPSSGSVVHGTGSRSQGADLEVPGVCGPQGPLSPGRGPWWKVLEAMLCLPGRPPPCPPEEWWKLGGPQAGRQLSLADPVPPPLAIPPSLPGRFPHGGLGCPAACRLGLPVPAARPRAAPSQSTSAVEDPWGKMGPDGPPTLQERVRLPSLGEVAPDSPYPTGTGPLPPPWERWPLTPPTPQGRDHSHRD